MVFDFYDLADLQQLAKQTAYLADVVGVIQESELTLARFKNKLGNPQTQMKFHISDGKTTIRVTFWDTFVESFEEALKEMFEEPLILIVGCGTVTEWQGDVDISNIGATTFHINSNHHSVNDMRNMLKDPNYKNQQYLLGKKPELKVIAVEEIMNYNLDSAEKEFLCDLTVSTVLQTTQWFRNIYTSCYEDTYSVDNL
ncbi:uncharacterized protein LOC141670649 [Apium graveolens]|uniref:uncharacterized protein LOC141670649 n=1 Tax=Apium graveolens TaxID=4045 RepID=UPI003D78DF03